MCTSFVLYAIKTYIGMNFDISDRPIRLTRPGGDRLIVTQQEGGRFLPAFGFTSGGTFMNLLMVDPNEAGQYRRGKNCVHIIRLFDDVLGGKVDLAGLGAYLEGKTVVNVPGISVHCMIAGPDRRTWVVEPGRGNIPFDGARQDHMVLTNFPLTDFAGCDVGEVTGAGAERYKTCHRLLNARREAFDVGQAMDILSQTAQANGDYPTQLSTVAVPEDGVVHLVVERDFARRYALTFADWTVRSEEGAEWALDKRGVLLSELSAP